MSSNPYQAPTVDDIKPGNTQYGMPMQRRGLVGHVRVIAILMIVQGVLEALMGVYLAAMGVFSSVVISQSTVNDGSTPAEQQQMAFAVVLVMYLGMGLMNCVAGGLHIYAAIRNYKFKSRTLGIVALSVGCTTMFAGCCGFTGIALAIYGMIVLLNAEVSHAFKMAESGYTGEQVLASFGEGFYPPK